MEDGHAQERRMIDQVLSRVREGELWIEDRNFCTRRLLFGMARRGAAFLVRQHAQLQGELLGSPTRTGVVRSGTVYEQAMIVHDLASGETMRVRRLTLALKVPTRDGATEIHLLSNIPVEEARARTLVGVYGKRWTIETAFFDLTTTLSCEINTLGYPKAALFAFCLALVAYNAVSIIKAALRRAHGKQKGDNEVSSYYLALEIRQTYDGMMIAIPAPHWAVFREMSAAEFAGVLCELASSAKLSKYRKHPRGPKKKPPERTAYKNGSHVSTARLIAQR
jgi:Transposase DDE domain